MKSNKTCTRSRYPVHPSMEVASPWGVSCPLRVKTVAHAKGKYLVQLPWSQSNYNMLLQWLMGKVTKQWDMCAWWVMGPQVPVRIYTQLETISMREGEKTIKSKQVTPWQAQNKTAEERKKLYALVPLMTVFSCFLNKGLDIFILHWACKLCINPE